MSLNKYKIRVIRGAFTNPNILDEYKAKVIEKLDGSKWQSIEELVVDIDQLKELKKCMTKHYDDVTAPWYMDGYNTKDKNNYVVAFGADDGEGGKLFQFKLDDADALKEVVEYGISKGIPKEQMDFMDIKF